MSHAASSAVKTDTAEVAASAAPPAPPAPAFVEVTPDDSHIRLAHFMVGMLSGNGLLVIDPDNHWVSHEVASKLIIDVLRKAYPGKEPLLSFEIG